MAVTLRCPGCGLQQRVDESRPGEKRCRECREVLTPDRDADDFRFAREGPARAPRRDEEDRPARPRREDHRDEDDYPTRPARRKGSSGLAIVWVLAAVGGGALLLVLGCAGAMFWAVSRTTITTTTSAGTGPNAAAPNNGVGKPPPAAGWKVRADPSPLPLAQVTRPGQTAKLGTTFPYIAVVAGSPGPFLASGSNDDTTRHREVWDLRTMEKVGELRGFRLRTHGVMTPDGAYLGGHLNKARGGYVVYSCKDGKKAFEVDGRDLGGASFYDFAGSRRFLIVTIGAKNACHVFDVPSGRKSIPFSTQPHNNGEPCATSPGGRYLALPSGVAFHLYDLGDGTLAGTFAAPRAWVGAEHREMAFSADGKELA